MPFRDGRTAPGFGTPIRRQNRSSLRNLFQNRHRNTAFPRVYFSDQLFQAAETKNPQPVVDLPLLLARFRRLLTQHVRQLVGERVKPARPIGRGEPRLDTVRAQVLTHRVARQPTSGIAATQAGAPIWSAFFPNGGAWSVPRRAGGESRP